MTKLDRCWKNQLRMSGWVAENLPEGFAGLSDGEKVNKVRQLKAQWLKQNRFTKPVSQDCFFCDYNGGVSDDGYCVKCPGRLVNQRLQEWWCVNANYCWCEKPKAFYRKIVALDKKRGTK